MKNKLPKLKINTKISNFFFISLIIVSVITIILIPNPNYQYTDSMPYGYLAYNTDQKRYLSDIEYLVDQTSVGYGSIVLDKNMSPSKNDGLITLIVNGEKKQFLKGVLAHATSTVVYDLSNYDYDFFTTYYGVDQSMENNGNGVKFAIYTSSDGTNWDLHTPVSPSVLKGNSEAQKIKISLAGVKYLKLYAHSNGNIGSDHAVYADAKLIKADYEDVEKPPVDFIKTVEEYDNIIKNKYGSEVTGDYELAILQRQLVQSTKYNLLQLFVNYSDENKEAFSWLFNNLENLRLYMMGGKPEGSYINSLKVLTDLYTNYHEDLNNTELTNYNHTYGEIYRKMLLTLSLTHSSQVALWMQPSHPKNQSDAVTRYRIFKDLHKNGKFRVNDTIDITKWFENYNIEEMRFVLNNIIDDEEILWLNEYTQSQIEAHPNQAWTYLTPHPYMAYVYPNYGNAIFHDPARKDYWDQKFNGIFSRYGVTYSTENDMVYKVWMNFRNEFGTGAVCGGISKTGSNIRTVHGIPAAVIGQPGHAAIIYYSQDENGNGYWNLDNDVSGWTLSEKSERMLLGWGNATYSRGYSVVYMALAQEVLNDDAKFAKSETLVYLANSYADDLNKKEEIYREALRIQPLNIDAWYELIQVYNANPQKTEDDYYALAKEIGESLKYFPLPMQHLTNLIKPKLTSVENQYKFTLLQTRILTEGSQTPNNTADNYYVYQPSLTRLEANYLLGKLDKTIATFSFDGDDAGKIVLSSRFDGNGIRWDYSLDGKNNWKEVSFTAEEDHKWTLTLDELNMINAQNDIYVHIVGLNYDEENLYKIDILEQPAPAIIYNNDLENKVIGATDNMEWRMANTNNWTSFKTALPDLTGDKTVYVRNQKTGVYLTSAERELTYTTDIIDPERKYVTIDHLSVYGVSSEAGEQDHWARYLIDGNINTTWHSAWNGSDTNRFITIKLDRAINLSALDYYPGDGGNGRITKPQILVSMTGEDDDWQEVASNINWANNNVKKTIEFDGDIPARYIKIVGVATSSTNGKSYMTGAMINIYEDTTKIIRPTAKITASTTEMTNGNVTLTLTPSTEITITSGDDWQKVEGQNKYTLVVSNNRKVIVKFVDENNIAGEAEYNVTNIDKEGPSGTISASTTDLTNQNVILTFTPNKEVTIISTDNWQKKDNVYTLEVTENRLVEITFTDKAGNTNNLSYVIRNIDKTPPVAGINVSTTKPTNQNVILTLITDEEIIIDSSDNWIKENDVYKLTVTENQNVVVKYHDLAGNSGQLSYNVTNIDKVLPVVNIKSSNTSPTNKSITLTLSTSKDITIDSNIKWKKQNNKTYIAEIFENKTIQVNYSDAANNKGNINFEVKNIDKVAPTVKIEPITKDPNKAAILTLTANEAITITSPDKWTKDPNSNKYTLIVSENKEIKVTYQDLAGNYGATTYKVDWLQKNSSNNPTPDDSNTSNNYNNHTEFKSNNIKLYLPNELITEKLNFKFNKLIISNELQKTFSKNSEYFRIYFQRPNNQIENFADEKMQLVISLDPTKKFLGIYEIGKNNTVTKLQYQETNPHEITVEISKLGSYLVSYDEEINNNQNNNNNNNNNNSNGNNNNNNNSTNNNIKDPNNNQEEKEIMQYIYGIVIAIVAMTLGIIIILKIKKKQNNI